MIHLVKYQRTENGELLLNFGIAIKVGLKYRTVTMVVDHIVLRDIHTFEYATADKWLEFHIAGITEVAQ